MYQSDAYPYTVGNFSECGTMVLQDYSPHLHNDTVIPACWGPTWTRFTVYWCAAILQRWLMWSRCQRTRQCKSRYSVSILKIFSMNHSFYRPVGNRRNSIGYRLMKTKQNSQMVVYYTLTRGSHLETVDNVNALDRKYLFLSIFHPASLKPCSILLQVLLFYLLRLSHKNHVS